MELVFAGHIILPVQSIATPFGKSEMVLGNVSDVPPFGIKDGKCITVTFNDNYICFLC